MTKDCNTCLHKEGSCYPSATIFDKDKTCKSYAPDYEGYIADLEQKLEQTEKDLADYQFNYPTIKELQEKNTELKKRNLDVQDAVTMQMYTNIANKEIADKQLAHAKEIIRALLKHTHGQNLNTQNDFDLYLGRIKEAEQFLKEVSDK